jgi:hypothetical protein
MFKCLFSGKLRPGLNDPLTKMFNIQFGITSYMSFEIIPVTPFNSVSPASEKQGMGFSGIKRARNKFLIRRLRRGIEP